MFKLRVGTPVLFFSALFIGASMAAAYSGNWFVVLFPFAALFCFAAWRQPRLIFFILIATIPFSAEVQVSSSLGTDFPDEGLMLLVSFLALAAWVYRPQFLLWRLVSHPLLALLFLVLAWMLVSVLFSTQPLISLKVLLAKSWYAGAFLLAPLMLFTTKKNISLAIRVLVAAMLSVTSLALLRQSFSGFSFAFVNDALRPFFRNHVNYSALLVCMFPPLMVIYRLNKNNTQRQWILLAMVIAAMAVFFSYSRGAWLALVTGAAGWWLIKRRLVVIVFLLVVLTATVALLWIKGNDRYLAYAPDYRTTIFHDNFGEHLEATYEMKDVSTAERFYRWIAGVRMIKEHPLVGFGPGSFYNNYQEYTIPAYRTWVSNNPDHSTVHNYFLLLVIEQGYPGLLLFLLLVTVMLWYAQHLYHRASNAFYKYVALATGSVLVMILTVNFLSDLIETDKIGSIFFLCLALLISADRNTRPLRNQPN